MVCYVKDLYNVIRTFRINIQGILLHNIAEMCSVWLQCNIHATSKLYYDVDIQKQPT